MYEAVHRLQPIQTSQLTEQQETSPVFGLSEAERAGPEQQERSQPWL